MHRFDPLTDIDETLGALSEWSGREGPRDRLVDVSGRADRRGAMGSRKARASSLPAGSAALLDLLRGIEAAMLPTAQRYGMGVLTYAPLSSGWLSGRADPTQGNRTARAPQAFDIPRPANKAKLEAVDALTKLAADVGMPLTHLAISFVRSPQLSRPCSSVRARRPISVTYSQARMSN